MTSRGTRRSTFQYVDALYDASVAEVAHTTVRRVKFTDIEAMNGDDIMSPVPLKTFPIILFALFVCPCVMGFALASLLGSGAGRRSFNAQTPNTTSHAGSQPVFHLDGGNTTYAFGVNERGELQQIYWGGRLGEHDVINPAKSEDDVAAFDSSYNNTPQEYAGWGSGLFLEPALKVTFVDGSRDLVLHYTSSSKHDDNSIDVVVKDISRAVIVTLHYKIDPGESGIVARSATIENHEPKPIMIEQAAAAAFSTPRRALHTELFERTLGGRMDAERGGDSPRAAGAGKPARIDWDSAQSMVRYPSG